MDFYWAERAAANPLGTMCLHRNEGQLGNTESKSDYKYSCS